MRRLFSKFVLSRREVIVGLVFFALGIIGTTNLDNFDWVLVRKDRIDSLIRSFKSVYEVQDQLKALCYEESTEIALCLGDSGKTCDYDGFTQRVNDIRSRKQLQDDKLTLLNRQAQAQVLYMQDKLGK